MDLVELKDILLLNQINHHKTVSNGPGGVERYSAIRSDKSS